MKLKHLILFNFCDMGYVVIDESTDTYIYCDFKSDGCIGTYSLMGNLRKGLISDNLMLFHVACYS